jgi:hypothetical protein
MIIKNTQQDVVINLSKDIKNVGIKLSGGADSAIVCYMLSLYVHTERSDIKIVPITVAQTGKLYQIIYASKIIEYCKQRFSDVFEKHYTDISFDPDADYIATQNTLLKNLYESKKIDCHFSGITLNPPDDAIPESVYQQGFKLPRPESGHLDRARTNKLKPNCVGKSNYPLLNIDKQGVAELYQTLNVLDSLFPLTRSCESFTTDFSHHCEKCWFCNERFWGFGRYE